MKTKKKQSVWQRSDQRSSGEHEQIRTEIAVVQAELNLEEAVRRWGMQAKLPTEVAAHERTLQYELHN